MPKFLRLLPLCLLVSAGCVKQDTEILSRVGQKIQDKLQASTAGLREKLPFRVVSATAETPALNEVVRQRLLDKGLNGLTIDVHANGAEVELKGTVEKDEQKRRAIDLAESTLGVEKVVDSLQVRGEN